MLRYVYIGDYQLNMRNTLINVGSVVAIIMVIWLLYRQLRDVRLSDDPAGSSDATNKVSGSFFYIILPCVMQVIIVFTLGAVLGRLVRGFTLPLTGNMSENVGYIFEHAGTHFLGIVMASFIVMPPLMYMIYHERAADMLNALAFFYTIQHLFNRLGCFMEGCCYGVPMHGVLSVRFPESVTGNPDYSVFPSQILEALFMLIILIFQIVLYRKKRNVFMFTIISFGVAIFISESFMDKRGTVRYMELSAIQIAAMLLAVCAFIVYVIQMRRRNK